MHFTGEGYFTELKLLNASRSEEPARSESAYTETKQLHGKLQSREPPGAAAGESKEVEAHETESPQVGQFHC